MNTKEIQYTVFTPQYPLSGVRWCCFQYADGSAGRTVMLKSGAVGTLIPLTFCDSLSNAFEWAHCLHDSKGHFEASPEASEIYSTLCNVVRHASEADNFSLRICLKGIIDDCNEWLRRVAPEEVAP